MASWGLITLVLLFCEGQYVVNHGGIKYIMARTHLGPPLAISHTSSTQQLRELFRLVPKPPGGIVFLGDSLTEGGAWADYFPGKNIANRAIGGSTVFDGIAIVHDGVLAGKPEKIFLQFSCNDFGAGESVDEFMLGYNKLLDAVTAASPQSKVFIQSTIPGRFDTGDAATPRWYLTANDRLRELAAKRGCVYVDVYPHLATDPVNALPAAFTVDRIHLTNQAYLLWVEVLRPYVCQS